jgi:hypothetical protein
VNNASCPVKNGWPGSCFFIKRKQSSLNTVPYQMGIGTIQTINNSQTKFKQPANIRMAS